MCGISGIFSTSPEDHNRMQAMLDSMVHRGPDDEGIYQNQNISLGQKRLSIIDLAGGHQPIFNEDKSMWIVCNGEIYNYQKLRDDLIAKGHVFTTKSDSEVILHLYEEVGEDCIKQLNGMFAFAIWDNNKQSIFAARDRLGQKPFYYYLNNNEFVFASEIKAILAYKPQLRQLNHQALDQYLTMRIISPPLSMFQNIRKLPPAHQLRFSAQNGIKISRYWQLDFEPKLTGSDDELTDELESRLIDCMKRHMVSDVPVGAFLSGGLDSTIVVAMTMKHVATEAMKTFSFGLPYQQYDEAPYAKMVAEKYGTEHYEKIITPSLVENLPELVWHLDEPSDPLSVCAYLISKMASEHVKVVLGGDGGDELFGGYDRYYGNKYASYYALIPEPIRKYMIGPALGLIPDGSWYKSKAHQVKWLHSLSYMGGGKRYAKSLSYFYFGNTIKDQLYTQNFKETLAGFDPENAIVEYYDSAKADDIVDKMLYADTCTRLPDHPVMISDRMTMASSLELRSPFMDHEISEFCAQLPVRMKVRGRSLRVIQYKLAQRYLPDEVVNRPKQGFSSALPYMLKEEYKQLFNVFLKEPTLVRDGLLNQGAINSLLTEHLDNKRDNGNRLWLILNAEVWYQMHIGNKSVSDLKQIIQQ